MIAVAKAILYAELHLHWSEFAGFPHHTNAVMIRISDMGIPKARINIV